MKINCIGAGRVGQTLMRMLQNSGFLIQGICNGSITSSRKAVKKIGGGVAYSTPQDLPDADMTFITAKDDALFEIAQNLSKSSHLSDGRIFIHCSGIHSSQTLSPLKVKNGYLASAHPVFSFSEQIDSNVINFPGTLCGVEGDIEAVDAINRLIKQIGGKTFVVHSDKKALYHASAVFSSNYVVTLVEHAKNCLLKIGVKEEEAMMITTGLLSSALNNLKSTMSPRLALTGPIQRGDVNTIEKHLSALNEVGLKTIYEELGRLTLCLVEQEKQDKLEPLFSDCSQS